MCDVVAQAAKRVRFIEEWSAAIAYSAGQRNSIVLNQTAYILYALTGSKGVRSDIIDKYVSLFRGPVIQEAALREDAMRGLDNLVEMGLLTVET
jgi:hypothetical protein